MSADLAAVPDQPWGRVEEDGTVLVREGEMWRTVGQYPDATAEEALAYYERKYTELAGEVTLLEQRHRRAGAAASGLRDTARALAERIPGAAAVGDLAALEARVLALTDELAEASEEEAAAAKEAVAAAITERTAIVEQAEAIAARDPKQVQWKQATEELNDLFTRWQSQQASGPRIPKRDADRLWKRFRDARSAVEKRRREFYAELDEAHKQARDRKQRLVARAEALAPQGEDGIPAYRALLDEWKTAGRAGRKVDDALYAKFKAAGDLLFAARAERDAVEVAESAPKIEEKKNLLDDARTVADIPDIADARAKLAAVQRRWDEIGRVQPREQDRSLDDALRKIEQAMRAREDAAWKRDNPETKARANDMARQLADAISRLEGDLEAARAKKDSAAISRLEAELETRRAWMQVVDAD